MDNPILERIRAYLLQKRMDLREWLQTSPSTEKAVWLGPSTEESVLAHIGHIEDCISRAESGTLGLCRVCQDYVETELLEVDYSAAVCLDHLSDEEMLGLEYELELAKAVQVALLPQEAPNIPGLDVAAYSRPAQFVGGDYFDFIGFDADTYGLAIADVAGHGVSASLQMASLQALARAIVPTSRSPSEVVEHIHSLFIHNIRFTTFVTLFVGAFAPATRTLRYCNAGHNPPLVIHQDCNHGSSVSWLNPTGAAMGLIEMSEFGESALSLDQGDLLVMYTDGVVEAVDAGDAFFGQDRLVEVVQRLCEGTPREIVRGIRESLERFTGDRPLSDDTTFVVCRVT